LAQFSAPSGNSTSWLTSKSDIHLERMFTLADIHIESIPTWMLTLNSYLPIICSTVTPSGYSLAGFSAYNVLHFGASFPETEQIPLHN
jgi:hypothetical protein